MDSVNVSSFRALMVTVALTVISIHGRIKIAVVISGQSQYLEAVARITIIEFMGAKQPELLSATSTRRILLTVFLVEMVVLRLLNAQGNQVIVHGTARMVIAGLVQG